MDIKQLKNFIIKPVLEEMGLYSLSAVNLLLGTMAVESNMGEYIRQQGFTIDSGNGAFGVYQIELPTHTLIMNWLGLNDKDHLIECLFEYRISDMSMKENLIGNLYYQTAIARCLYYSISAPLPKPDDIKELANYWKKYYNRGGKGTVEKFIESYNRKIY